MGSRIQDGLGVWWPVTLSWVAARGFENRGRNRAVVRTRRRDAGRGRLVAAMAEGIRGKGMGGSSHGFGWEQGRGKKMGIAMVASPWMLIEQQKRKRKSPERRNRTRGREGREHAGGSNCSDTNCQDPMVSDTRGSRRRGDFGRNHR